MRLSFIFLLLILLSSAAAEEIIVDNQDAGISSSGNWWVSSGADPYLGESLYSNRLGYFSWTVPVSYAGQYDVYAWWTYHPNRSTNVPYDIELGDNSARVIVNQRNPTLGGQWNLLGRFSFNTRFGSIFVNVSSENGQASADAVRFVRVEPEGWPFDSCVCDVFYERAIDKYLGYGGSLIPPGLEGGASQATCSNPNSTLDVDARYTTIVNQATGDSVSLYLSAYGTPSSGGTYVCEAGVGSSIVPNIYSEDLGITPDQYAICRESVFNFCKNDIPP